MRDQRRKNRKDGRADNEQQFLDVDESEVRAIAYDPAMTWKQFEKQAEPFGKFKKRFEAGEVKKRG